MANKKKQQTNKQTLGGIILNFDVDDPTQNNKQELFRTV